MGVLCAMYAPMLIEVPPTWLIRYQRHWMDGTPRFTGPHLLMPSIECSWKSRAIMSIDEDEAAKITSKVTCWPFSDSSCSLPINSLRNDYSSVQRFVLFLSTRQHLTDLPRPNIRIPSSMLYFADFSSWKANAVSSTRRAMWHSSLLMPMILLLTGSFSSHFLFLWRSFIRDRNLNGKVPGWEER